MFYYLWKESGYGPFKMSFFLPFKKNRLEWASKSRISFDYYWRENMSLCFMLLLVFGPKVTSFSFDHVPSWHYLTSPWKDEKKILNFKFAAFKQATSQQNPISGCVWLCVCVCVCLFNVNHARSRRATSGWDWNVISKWRGWQCKAMHVFGCIGVCWYEQKKRGKKIEHRNDATIASLESVSF